MEEAFVKKSLFLCAGLSVIVTMGIIAVLLSETIEFFRTVSIREFFGSATWAPMFEPRQFGIWPLVGGTFLITAGAGLIGIPGGLGVGLFLNEFAAPGVRAFIKPLLEILAGIPTVVYGYFALTVVTPTLQRVLPDTEVFNAASAAIVVGIMVLPMVASLCDDALRAVPRSVKEAGYALGATKCEVSLQVTVPAALSGIIASFILAISRAFGETMAVTLAAGSTPRLTLNPLQSIQTLTSYIVQVSTGDTPQGSIEYKSIFAVGMLLLVVTLLFNMLAYSLVKRFRSVYE
ncbi:MAG: phosphate ABC transporter permease subunit PstC [Proteobacteria bacterium]|nr:phosphate ABC transporter permease subunit PstC [Pseudomonadota bacterium]